MRPGPARHGVLLAFLLAWTLTGCSADDPLNPSFPLTLSDARTALKQMEREPKPFERPVVLLGGIYDPGVVISKVERRLRRVTTRETTIVKQAFFGAGSFEECRERLHATLIDEFGPAPQAVEVDVVAFSMGGLVARYSALEADAGRAGLRIRRLFTIGTPHRGAKSAGLPTFDRRVVAMRAGSEFLTGLDEALDAAEYELHAYVRLGDAIVGTEQAAPEGRHPWWVKPPALEPAHLAASEDPRILADIVRRLRGETAWATSPAAPLPEPPPRHESP